MFKPFDPIGLAINHGAKEWVYSYRTINKNLRYGYISITGLQQN
jgi:hypothetical protein